MLSNATFYIHVHAVTREIAIGAGLNVRRHVPQLTLRADHARLPPGRSIALLLWPEHEGENAAEAVPRPGAGSRDAARLWLEHCGDAEGGPGRGWHCVVGGLVRAGAEMLQTHRGGQYVAESAALAVVGVFIHGLLLLALHRVNQPDRPAPPPRLAACSHIDMDIYTWTYIYRDRDRDRDIPS